MVQGEPEDEDRHARVLDSSFDGNGNDILHWPSQDLSDGKSHKESNPWQSHACHKHLPSHQLEDVEVSPDPENDDEQDQEQGHGFEDPHQEVGQLGSPSGNGQSDRQGNDQEEGIDDNLVIGDDDVRFVKNGGSKGEDPERHHEEGREGRHGRHRHREIQVAAEHDSPNVGRSSSRRGT